MISGKKRGHAAFFFVPTGQALTDEADGKRD
jgi:hypothetical protein